MRYEEYLEKLKNAVEKKLGCPIEIKEIKKNNGYTYRGLVVHDGASIKPVIADYLMMPPNPPVADRKSTRLNSSHRT